MEGQIVQLNASRKSEEGTGLVQISRRRFLQALGATTAVGATACANPVEQNILPNVKGIPEMVPGVSVWYSSTCTECTTGCGISQPC